MKVAAKSLRMALGAAGRSAIVRMAVCRVGDRNLTLPKRRLLSTPHGISKLFTVETTPAAPQHSFVVLGGSGLQGISACLSLLASRQIRRHW